MLRNNEWVNKMKDEIKTSLEKNYNENTMTPNLWGTANAILRGKLIAIEAFLKKQEKFQINNLNLYLKQQDKEQLS